MTFTPTVLTDAYIVINSNVFSDHANKVQLNFSVEALEATTFGQTAKVRRGGLQDGTIDISFLNDYSAANLDALMFALLGSVVAYEVRPTSSARSTTNAAYVGNILVDSWKPIGGDVGKLVMVDCSFPTSGLNTRATS